MVFKKIKQYDTTFPAKLFFRVLLIVSVWISTGLFGYFISQLPYVYSPWSLVVSFTVCPLGLAFWWSFLTQLISLIRRRPVHPAAYVVIDLILTVLVGGLAILATVVINTRLRCLKDTEGDYALITEACMSSFNWEDNGDSDTRWYYDAFDYYGYGVFNDTEFNDYLKQLDTITLVGCGFAIFVAVLEFILFIWACADIPRYRRLKRERKAQKATQMGWNNNVQQGGYIPPPPPQNGYPQPVGGYGQYQNNQYNYPPPQG